MSNVKESLAALTAFIKSPVYAKIVKEDQVAIARQRREIHAALRESVLPLELERAGAEKKLAAARAKNEAAQAQARAAEQAAFDIHNEMKTADYRIQTLQFNARRKLVELADPRISRLQAHIQAVIDVARGAVGPSGEPPRPATLVHRNPPTPLNYRAIEGAMVELRDMVRELDDMQGRDYGDDAWPTLAKMLDRVEAIIQPLRASATQRFPIFSPEG